MSSPGGGVDLPPGGPLGPGPTMEGVFGPGPTRRPPRAVTRGAPCPERRPAKPAVGVRGRSPWKPSGSTTPPAMTSRLRSGITRLDSVGNRSRSHVHEDLRLLLGGKVDLPGHREGPV